MPTTANSSSTMLHFPSQYPAQEAMTGSATVLSPAKRRVFHRWAIEKEGFSRSSLMREGYHSPLPCLRFCCKANPSWVGFCLPRRAGGIQRPSLAQGDITASISQKGADAQSLSSCQLPGQIRVGTCARFKPGTGGFVAPPRKVAGSPHLARQQLSARLLPVGDSAENALAVVAAVLFSRPAGAGYWRGSGR